MLHDLEEKQLKMINDIQLFLKNYNMKSPQCYLTGMIITGFLYGMQTELESLAVNNVDFKMLLHSSSNVLKKIQKMIKNEMSKLNEE